jgi:hypothetical protein
LTADKFIVTVFILKLSEKNIMEYYEKYKPRMNELEAFNMVNLSFEHVELEMLLNLNTILLSFIMSQPICVVFFFCRKTAFGSFPISGLYWVSVM